MKTIRRLYFYAIAMISLEVVLWGMIGLLRSILKSDTVINNAQTLAEALSLILVGVPIFLFHWLWAQSLSAKDDDEKTASLRAVFLYGVLLATLIPAIQNLLALINRAILSSASLYADRAIVGGSQTWLDNLIAIVINLLIAAYFWNVLRSAWLTLPAKEDFSDVRRLSRFIWMLYGLLLTLYGAQQALDYAFTLSVNAVLGDVGRETAVNAIALLLIGSPLWYFSWRVLQNNLPDPDEKDSYLRLGILYLLALGGVLVTLTSGATLFYMILMRLFGEEMSAGDFIQQIGNPISIGVPFAVIWAYYGKWLNEQFLFEDDTTRRAGKKRLYFYILSFIGLAVAVFGVQSLFTWFIDLATDIDYINQSGFSSSLSRSLAALIVGLPLWLSAWRPMQSESLANDSVGEDARRSLLRRVYLYLVIFAAVIGGMVSAGALLYAVINKVLGGESFDFVNTLFTSLMTLLLFVILLLYHLYSLRRDGSIYSEALNAKQTQFGVLAFDSADGKFGADVESVFAKRAPKIPVTVLKASQAVPADAKPSALVMPGSLAVNAPENVRAWIGSYNGTRFIVPDDAAGVYWMNDLAQAAESARTMAEGQDIRPQAAKKAAPVWTYIAYAFAALFACELVFLLIAFAISMVAGF